MKLLFTGVILTFLFLPLSSQAAEPLSAKAILDRVDDLFRGDASHGRMTMTIHTEHWQRALTLDFWGQGKEKSFIRILAPEKEKGTATLRNGSDLWNFLPKVNRVVKLPSSMMSASWMGSHFSNDDLVKESRFSDDYTFEISREGTENNLEIVEITCIPKPEAAIVWGKVVVKIKRQALMPIVTSYYDEDLKLARTMRFEEVALLGGKMLPSKLVIVPADKPSEFTAVKYEKIEFDDHFSPDVFSLRNLQR